VKHLSTESGHLGVALSRIGNVLTFSPPDPQGLWIDQTVAAALNEKDSDRMRNGFRSQIINSRGAHWVDPTAKPELELAEAYKQKADVTENAGYFRLAITLREIAELYEHEAQRIPSKH
jgi:hypothetical protein